MKYLFLILIFLTTSVFSGYVSKAKLLDPDCDASRPFYLKKLACDKVSTDCVWVPKNYFCLTYSELDTNVDDPTKPNYSKNEIEACSDQADCESKNAVKTCIDTEERVIMAQNYSEIYCTKLTGYDQMVVKMIREDPTKKAAFDASEAAKTLVKANRKTEIQQIKAALNAIDSSSKPAWEKKLLKRLVKELRE